MAGSENVPECGLNRFARPIDASPDAVHAAIANEAYRRWIEHGRRPGTAESDWLDAEHAVEERLEMAGKAGMLFTR